MPPDSLGMILDDLGTLLAHVVDVLVTLLTRVSPVVVILAMLITLLAHVVDVFVILARLSKSRLDRLVLTSVVHRLQYFGNETNQ